MQMNVVNQASCNFETVSILINFTYAPCLRSPSNSWNQNNKILHLDGRIWVQTYSSFLHFYFFYNCFQYLLTFPPSLPHFIKDVKVPQVFENIYFFDEHYSHATNRRRFVPSFWYYAIEATEMWKLISHLCALID